MAIRQSPGLTFRAKLPDIANDIGIHPHAAPWWWASSTKGEPVTNAKRFSPRATLGSLLAAVALFAAGCGGASGPKTEFLSIGTAPVGGAFFPVGGALAGALNSTKDVNHWEATAEATKGSQENILRLASGDMEFAVSNSAISYFAYKGEEGWDKPQPIAAVMTLAPNVAMFIANKSSGLKTIPDLKGKRVVVGPSGAGFEYFLKPLLAANGVKWDEITPLYNTQSAAVDMLSDGAAAAAFLGGAVPTASITQAATSMDVQFIPFDPKATEELINAYPFFQRQIVKPDTYKGQTEPLDAMDVGSMHFITSTDQNEDLVYRVTKTLWEKRDVVVSSHAAGKAINPKNVIRDTGIPFHPGAIRFYKEIGIWPGSEAKTDEKPEAKAETKTEANPAAAEKK